MERISEKTLRKIIDCIKRTSSTQALKVVVTDLYKIESAIRDKVEVVSCE